MCRVLTRFVMVCHRLTPRLAWTQDARKHHHDAYLSLYGKRRFGLARDCQLFGLSQATVAVGLNGCR